MTSAGSQHPEYPINLSVSRDELSIMIGSISEAVFNLGDDEFAIRVGPTAQEARNLVQRLVAIRRPLDSEIEPGVRFDALEHRLPDSTVDQLQDWVLDVAISETRVVERSEIISELLVRAQESPESADSWMLLGFAYYHLWRPLPIPEQVEAVKCLNHALRLEPGREFCRLYKLYVEYEAGYFVPCLSDCWTIDRDHFRGDPDLAWRAITIDEYEFGCLAELGMMTHRLEGLFREVVRATLDSQSDLWPHVPSTLIKAVPKALLVGLPTVIDGKLVEDIVGELAPPG